MYNVNDALINWGGFVALKPLSNECEALLSDGLDLVAEEMRLELGWNSTSTTTIHTTLKKLVISLEVSIFFTVTQS